MENKSGYSSYDKPATVPTPKDSPQDGLRHVSAVIAVALDELACGRVHEAVRALRQAQKTLPDPGERALKSAQVRHECLKGAL